MDVKSYLLERAWSEITCRHDEDTKQIHSLIRNKDGFVMLAMTIKEKTSIISFVKENSH